MISERWARAMLLALVAGATSEWLAPERRERFRHHLALAGELLLQRVSGLKCKLI